jgi:hypothetical protein
LQNYDFPELFDLHFVLLEELIFDICRVFKVIFKRLKQNDDFYRPS